MALCSSQAYKPLRCPTGETHNRPVNHQKQKYSPLQNFGFVAFFGHLIPCQRGRIAIVTNVG